MQLSLLWGRSECQRRSFDNRRSSHANYTGGDLTYQIELEILDNTRRIVRKFARFVEVSQLNIRIRTNAHVVLPLNDAESICGEAEDLKCRKSLSA